MATIYRKTAKGQNEIETRALKLAPRFRSLLILVDGRRSDEELAQLMPQAGAEALDALLAGGLIEVIGVTSAPPPAAPRAAPAPAPAPARPAEARTAASDRSHQQRRREVVRALTDLVGPMSEALAIRIERAATPAELAPLIELAAQTVANVRGRAVADIFRQRFADTPPET